MPDQTEYQDLDDLVIGGEEDVVLASPDYAETDYPVIDPGKYLSRFRKIQARVPVKDPATGAYKYVIDCSDGGLEDLQGNVIKYPPRSYIDTLMREVKYSGTGSVSSVQRYLQAFKSLTFDSKVASQVAALKESTGLPAYVIVEWEDDYRERPEGAKALHTKAFKVGDRFLPVIKIEGRLVKARPKLARWKPID